jgi:hypothetical protein
MKVRTVVESLLHGLARRVAGGYQINGSFQVAFIASIILLLTAPITHAQNLNWEGQTGAFVTPFAYVSPSSGHSFGTPAVSFHYLDGGDVIGGLYQVSVTTGLFKRFEIGYTRSLNSAGETPALSPLFEGGFNTFHAKANLLPENAGKHNYLPALAVGFIARTQVRHVGGVLTGKNTTNGDVYLVATKTITQTKVLPIVVNFGIKATDASVYGIAGNAPVWQGRLFGALAFVLPGPARSKLVVGSEVAQEPHHIQDLPGATLPTTLTYFVRILLPTERHLNIDFGIAQAAGFVLPNADIKARAQFATGISYRF